MIEAHVGLPGQGKSVHLVHRAKQARKEGKRVVANFHCQTGLWEFMLWDQMLEVKNCLVLIDEAQMWFSSRKWNQQEQADLAMFQQHRKEGLDLVWCAQHESRVDLAIREVTHFIWRHKKLGPFVIANKVTKEDQVKALERRWLRISPSIYQHFFTEEIIGFRDGLGYRMGDAVAYATQERVHGGAFDEHLQLKPNYYRIELPGTVKYLHVNDHRVASEIGFALCEWRGLGNRLSAAAVVVACYRGVDGMFHDLDLDGHLVPNQDRLDLFEEAEELAKNTWRQLNGVFVSTPPLSISPANVVKALEPVAAIARALPQSVLKLEPGEPETAKSQNGEISEGSGALARFANIGLAGVGDAIRNRIPALARRLDEAPPTCNTGAQPKFGLPQGSEK